MYVEPPRRVAYYYIKLIPRSSYKMYLRPISWLDNDMHPVYSSMNVHFPGWVEHIQLQRTLVRLPLRSAPFVRSRKSYRGFSQLRRNGPNRRRVAVASHAANAG